MNYWRWGIRACALSFFQAGIFTDDNYEYASVLKMDSRGIKKKLQHYDVIVVGGFCGSIYAWKNYDFG